MFKNLIITTLIILSSLSAYADDYDNFNSGGQKYKNFNSTKGDKYRDWNNVKNMLASKGIEVRRNERVCRNSYLRGVRIEGTFTGVLENPFEILPRKPKFKISKHHTEKGEKKHCH